MHGTLFELMGTMHPTAAGELQCFCVYCWHDRQLNEPHRRTTPAARSSHTALNMRSSLLELPGHLLGLKPQLRQYSCQSCAPHASS
jgi:hypothetical protein